jgi:hypothetical protein
VRLSCLPRGMGEAQGKKVEPTRLRLGDRGAAVLWPDQAIRRHVARAIGQQSRRRLADIMPRTRRRFPWAKKKKPSRTQGLVLHSAPREPRVFSAHIARCRLGHASACIEALRDATALIGLGQSERRSGTNVPARDGRSTVIGRRPQAEQKKPVAMTARYRTRRRRTQCATPRPSPPWLRSAP